MALLNSSKAEAASIKFEAIFASELVKHPQWAKEVARVISMQTDSMVLPFTVPLSGAAEWVGPQVWGNLGTQDVTLKSKLYSHPVELERNHVEDDMTGHIEDAVFGHMGAQMANLPNKLVSLALQAGFASVGYDGVNYFSAAHTEFGGANQSNTGTDALDSTAFDAAVAQMQGIKSASGEPINFQPTHLVVGPSNRARGRGILEVERLASGADNPNFGLAKMIVSPWITGDNWFLMDLSKAAKPMLLGIRQEPDFNSVIDPSADCVKDRNVYQYYSRARMVAEYGLWQLCFGSTGAGQ